MRKKLGVLALILFWLTAVACGPNLTRARALKILKQNEASLLARYSGRAGWVVYTTPQLLPYRTVNAEEQRTKELKPRPSTKFYEEQVAPTLPQRQRIGGDALNREMYANAAFAYALVDAGVLRITRVSTATRQWAGATTAVTALDLEPTPEYQQIFELRPGQYSGTEDAVMNRVSHLSFASVTGIEPALGRPGRNVHASLAVQPTAAFLKIQEAAKKVIADGNDGNLPCAPPRGPCALAKASFPAAIKLQYYLVYDDGWRVER